MAKSVLGGLFGAILATELFKRRAGIHGSTGLYFVPGLTVLIAVGRVGCFLDGLHDFTYGTAAHLPWAVDFGDGVPRHPVQLYEGLAMLAFLVLLSIDYRRDPEMWRRQGFYLFVLVYAGQRFLWEFLKPYGMLAAGLNLFQWLCLLLLVYALVMLRRSGTRAQ